MADLTPPVDRDDHSAGPNNAPVILVEYGDFECEYCGAAYPVLTRVRGQMGDSLRFVFRHFPLTQSHPHAQLAAEAAEASAAQGFFWPMHDLLFRRQDALEADQLVEYARQIGLDIARFSADLQQHRFAQKVRADFLSGVRSGVNGTPTFFINGERFEGYIDLPGLLEALRAYLPDSERRHTHLERSR